MSREEEMLNFPLKEHGNAVNTDTSTNKRKKIIDVLVTHTAKHLSL